MFSIDADVVINQSPEDVFSYIRDARNIPKWRPEVTAIERGGPLQLGSEFDETFNFLGKKTSRMRVVKFEPTRLLAVKALSGPMMRPTQTFTVTPYAGGTQLTVHIDMDVDSWAIFLEFLFRRMIQRLWAKYLVTLKRLLEGPSPSRK